MMGCFISGDLRVKLISLTFLNHLKFSAMSIYMFILKQSKGERCFYVEEEETKEK